jgi:hypothetical protein
VTTRVLTVREREAFYSAAVLGLRALDVREPVARRFGLDADARWVQFAGALGPSDRLDILLRDAARTWGAAFSPSDCFGFFGLAADEPFGPDWEGIPDLVAKKLMTESDRPTTIENVAAALGVAVTTVPVPSITPATKLVVAGGAALAAVAKAFASDRALSWTDQVVAVATMGPSDTLPGWLRWWLVVEAEPPSSTRKETERVSCAPWASRISMLSWFRPMRNLAQPTLPTVWGASSVAFPDERIHRGRATPYPGNGRRSTSSTNTRPSLTPTRIRRGNCTSSTTRRRAASTRSICSSSRARACSSSRSRATPACSRATSSTGRSPRADATARSSARTPARISRRRCSPTYSSGSSGTSARTFTRRVFLPKVSEVRLDGGRPPWLLLPDDVGSKLVNGLDGRDAPPRSSS